jgi:hypothetical protein
MALPRACFSQLQQLSMLRGGLLAPGCALSSLFSSEALSSQTLPAHSIWATQLTLSAGISTPSRIGRGWNKDQNHSGIYGRQPLGLHLPIRRGMAGGGVPAGAESTTPENTWAEFRHMYAYEKRNDLQARWIGLHCQQLAVYSEGK